MEVVLDTAEKIERTIPLSLIAAGKVCRFAYDSLDSALEHKLFWMRISAPELKDQSRVRLVNLADGSQLERDGDHRVVEHQCTMKVST